MNQPFTGHTSTSLRRAIERGASDVHATRWRLILVVSDVLLVLGSLVAVLGWNLGRGQAEIGPWTAALLAAPLLMVCFQVAGAYDVRIPGRAGHWITAALRGHVLLLVGLMVLLFLSGYAREVPRLAFVAWAVAAAGLLSIERFALAWLSGRLRPRGLATPVVLAGTRDACLSVLDHLVANPEVDREVVGIACDGDGQGLPVQHMHLDGVAALALECGASEVLICGSLGDQALVDLVSDRLIDFPIEIHLVPDLQGFPLFCLRVDDLSGRPCLSLSASPLSLRDQLVKRMEDIVLSSLILLLIWPLMLLVAAGVRAFNGPGPVLFVQRRHGFMGRTIEVYKFRTMTWSPTHVPGPDDASAIRRAADEEFLDPPTGQFRQTKSADLRVTAFGRILRSSSLDELPQFLNVLKGDMSVVGPRPHARRHNLEFLQTVPGLMRRHFVKPGITGLAQISGARGRTRDVEDMANRLAYDLTYIRTWSLWLDLWIILRTLLVGFYTREP